MQKTITIIIIFLFLSLPDSVFTQEKSPKLESSIVYAGYSSLLPGLGQFKKSRKMVSIFIFSAFGASTYNPKLNHDNFLKERKKYENNIQALNLASTNPLRENSPQDMLLSTILANQIYKGSSNFLLCIEQ